MLTFLIMNTKSGRGKRAGKDIRVIIWRRVDNYIIQIGNEFGNV